MKFMRVFLLLFFPYMIIAQDKTDKFNELLTDYVITKNNPEDYSDYSITHNHISSTSRIHHFYLNQRLKGIEIENSVMSLHINRNGKLVDLHDQFLTNIAGRADSPETILPATEAFVLLCEQMNYPEPENIVILTLEPGPENKTSFKAENIAVEPVLAKLKYQYIETGTLRLSWDFTFEEISGHHYWSIRVDAQTGQILDKKDWAVHCSFECTRAKSPTEHHRLHVENQYNFPPTPFNQYRVFPLGIESPNHGSRELLTDPAFTAASPFGWHDTNGISGAEHTVTKGNNAEAREDIDGSNTTLGQMAEGGADLVFDFPILPNVHPHDNQDAAITNLFYWNNINHDIFYMYGFDEASGNFQQNNYGNGGLANDYVRADALDGGGTNNANFSTPVDGSRPRMQMYLWTSGSSAEINAPEDLAGSYAIVSASFGPTNFSVNGNVVLVDDGSTNPNLGCNALINSAELSGQIAMVDRGTCEFGTKCLNAQNAGAAAVIVCNNTTAAPIAMGAGSDGDEVTIPSVMMSLANCNAIKDYLDSGVNLTLSGGLIDGDYDNGVITHEYGHGISTRLTGGAGNSSCLSNQEQMGEGWSDWFGLMLTMQEDDLESEGRGIGTYVLNEPVTGDGIRTYRYSTDMDINPHTYDDIKSSSLSVPHGVGSVWCAMLWELTWAMIREYGFDPDLYTGIGGNNKALALVVEALKLQPCSPGFVDGRDAILAADQELFDGKHQCLIWHSFAKRGLGYSADQGLSSSRSDGTEAFDMPGSCCKFVSSLEDSGPGSLREAVNCAEIGDTIFFSNFLENEEISLSSGPILIDRALTFSHPRPGLITVAASDATRVFEIVPHANGVVVENLNLKSGTALSGNTILNSGQLKLINTQIIDISEPGDSESTVINKGSIEILGNNALIAD